MKRWQDCGEVLDSDDEELSLGLESQSPSHARKRIRLEDDGPTSGLVEIIRSSPNAERLTSQSGHYGQHETGVEHEAISLPPQSSPDRTLNGEIPQLSDAHTTDPWENRSDKGTENTTSGAAATLFSPHHRNWKRSTMINGLSSSQSSKSEGLPDLRDLLAGGTHRYRHEPFRQDHSQSSGLSSPLSERELSPLVPGKLISQALQCDAAEVMSHSDDDNHRGHDGEALDLHNERIEERAGGRSLRARNEKQLHPYLFDRAQHQKQFRNYGIRPIQVVQGLKTNETHDSQLSNDDNNSDHSWLDATPQQKPSSPTHIASRSSAADESDSELPDMSALLGQTSARSKPRAMKRRKLSHVAPGRLRTQEEFSIPPSPPLTSSDSIPRSNARPIAAHFRFPRGLTPEPLMTPQLSSVMRQGEGDERVDQEREAETGGQTTSSRRKPALVVIESSDDSSQEQRENEANERRLRRERKRIKGVLPASWLKIDFRAQQKQDSPSPARVRRLSSTSPSPTAPQRGVAQRVSIRRPISSNHRNVIDISDESEEDGNIHHPGSPEMRQIRLDFRPNRATTALSDLVDDERMEMDWVDPMLAGTSHGRQQKQSRKRQPKITASFGRQRDVAMDFSGEVNTIPNATGVASRNTILAGDRTRPRMTGRKRVNRMSIVDAPPIADTTSGSLPQFVRVAMRRARKQPNQARHSPSGKVIRLALRDDTEEAMSILRSWREGTIIPAPVDQRARSPGASSEQTHRQFQPAVRTPLTELPRNGQQYLPPPLRQLEHSQRSHNRSGATTKTARQRQTQLRPFSLPENEHVDGQQLNDHEEASSSNATEERPNRKPLGVQIRPTRYRDAQLETLEDDFTREHRAAAFERRMSRLTESIASRHLGSSGADFQLNRFLHNSPSTPAAVAPQHANKNGVQIKEVRNGATNDVQETALPHRPRKRLARRVDAEAREFRQPSEPLPDAVESAFVGQPEKVLSEPVLVGLGPYGTRYATDFDVLPLPLGSYFHDSSFIGSGDFAASLTFAGRDLDTPTGRIRIHLEGRILEWGAWTEDVAAGLYRIPNAISDALNTVAAEQDDETLQLVISNVDYLLRSTVRYLTRCLAFLDPIDRRACVQSLQRLLEDLLEIIAQRYPLEQGSNDILARCMQYAVVLLGQFDVLCSHSLLSSETKALSRQLLFSAMTRLGRHVFPGSLRELRRIYEENRRAAKLASGFRDTDTAICSLVILHHVARSLKDPQTNVWTFLSPDPTFDASSLNSIGAFDKVWYDIFTIQPALEIDERGILRTGSRMQGNHGDWDLPKILVQRLLELYSSTISLSGSTINEYVRATFGRCNILISRWGWWRCESLLSAIFDFFARRNLVQVQNEENRGSPKFLSSLQHSPSFEALPEDPSFHVFLKSLASALQGMRKYGTYSDKKVGGIAWRFIPNHGRTYRKDAELRQEDLDALRNHHDLLCTLYYAAPSTQRLRVNLIEHLVDHAVSHREVCRLNIRAWSNLVNFQASADEPTQRLDPFKEWLQNVITATISQYRLARSEVEHELAVAIGQGKMGIPQSVVEDTIARNQRQIAASLTDTLVALKHSLECARSLDIVSHLLESSGLLKVFTLFDTSTRRLDGTLLEALNVMTTALDVQQKFLLRTDSQQGSDDSQDYGDILALQEFASTQAQRDSKKSVLLDILQPPLAILISNIFGSDTPTDDALLVKLVDTWIRVALLSVQSGDRTWSSYIHGYSSDAWSQWRDTEQRRKYTNYFLSRVVELGDVDVAESGILKEWLESLVEREALLKFQHKLTSALLNRHPSEPILHNLPFTPGSSGIYDISMQDLRQRRLSLLSTVLSNMRTSFDDTLHHRPNKLQALRQNYAGMLRIVMQAMKQHYQELQTSPQAHVADLQARGAYVEFVQHVVTFLQQYSTDICPVDRFFTDSAMFPLPATDPTYVVGRLRSYVPKIGEARKRKELAAFIHTVSERAVVEGHQTYLINQLASAMADDVERGGGKSLRHILFTTIFPAYVEQALSATCAWIIAVPILEACSRTAAMLLCKIVFEDNVSVDAAFNTIGTILQSALRPIEATLVHYGQIRLPHLQRLLAAIFKFARSSLALVSYLERRRGLKSACGDILAHFYRVAECLNARLILPSTEVEDASHHDLAVGFHCPWPDTRDYVQKQVQEKFANDWYAVDGEYYVRRGASSLPIVTDLADDEDARLREAFAMFRESYEVIVLREVRDTRQDEVGVAGVIV